MRITTLIIFLISLNATSQEGNILDLENLKLELTSQISVLNDSLNKINIEIGIIHSKNIIKKVSDSSLVSIAKKGSKIRNTPYAMGDLITKLDEKKQVIILDYIDGYFGICIDSVCGYMSEMWIEKSDRINEFLKVKKQEQDKLKSLENENKLKSQKIEYAKLQKEYIIKYGQKTYNKLKKGNYWLGMTREMAMISLGTPKDINRTVGSWGVHEQWIYNNIYLYFENGTLKSYQN